MQGYFTVIATTLFGVSAFFFSSSYIQTLEDVKNLGTQLAQSKEKINSLEDCLSLLKTSNSLSKVGNEQGVMSLFLISIFKMTTIKYASIGLLGVLGAPLGLFLAKNVYGFVMYRHSLIEVNKTLLDIANREEATSNSLKCLYKASSAMADSFNKHHNIMASAINTNRQAIIELKKDLTLLTSSHKLLSDDVKDQSQSIVNLDHGVRQILDNPANLADTGGSGSMDMLD